MPEFGLINMNGRLCDPVLGRMLSPDNFVQAPVYTQNFNRYSYVLNNPLRYTDPDGEWVVKALMTVVGMYWGGTAANNFQFNPQHWNWKNPMTYIGMAQGAVGGYFEGAAMEQDWLNFKSSRPYKFKIDKNPVFYAWGKGDPNNEFDTYVANETIIKGTRITNWMLRIWNSNLMRNQVEDRYTLKFNYNVSPITGIGQSLEFHIMTRGPEPGFFVTNSISQRFGFEGDVGVEFGASQFNGPLSEMTRASVKGRYYDIDLGLGIDASAYLSFDKYDKILWYGGGAGVGMTIGASYGVGITRMGFSTYTNLH